MSRRHEPIERQQRKARGDGRTPGGREIVKAPYTIVKRVDAPPTPRGLQVRGKQEWDKIWASGPWLNPDQDYAWVEMTARAYDDIATFRKRIESDGLIVTGYAGQTVAHPLIAEIRKCEAVIQKCLSILGYSPTDRARLGLAEIKKEDALAKFRKTVEDNAKPPTLTATVVERD